MALRDEVPEGEGVAAAFLRALTASILILGMISAPALAQEDRAGSTSSEIVGQALQMLREAPEDLAQVMELIRMALEIEAAGPTGTVKNLELQSAIVAIRRGDVVEAERRLLAALDPDPHAKHHDPLASAPPEPEPGLLSAAPPTSEFEAGTISTGALTVGGPGREGSGAGSAQILGYLIVAVGTAVLGRAAVVEARRSRR